MKQGQKRPIYTPHRRSLQDYIGAGLTLLGLVLICCTGTYGLIVAGLGVLAIVFGVSMAGQKKSRPTVGAVKAAEKNNTAVVYTKEEGNVK